MIERFSPSQRRLLCLCSACGGIQKQNRKFFIAIGRKGGGEEFFMSDLDTDRMRAVAEQLMSGVPITSPDNTLQVERVGKKRFRMARFEMNGREYQAIEQNPEKPSTWGKLARQGHKVVQFRDVASYKYVAVAVDGKIREYGR